VYLCICVNVYVCVYKCICVYLYVYVCICVYLYVCVKRYALKQDPQFALFCFFEGNDIKDIAEYHKWEKGQSYYGYFSRRFIQRYLKVIRDVWDVLSRAKGADNGILVELNVNDAMRKDVFLYKSDNRTSEELLKTREWQDFKRILVDFRDVCMANDIVPVIVFLPQKSNIYGAYATDDSEMKWTNMKDRQISNRHNVEDALKVVTDEADITMISLTPLLEKIAEEGIWTHIAFDTHWSSIARERSAAYVAERLNRIINE